MIGTKLKDKVAIVTGAGAGIGRGIAHALAKEGAKVVIADINGGAASEVAGEIMKLGGRALAVQCDVGNRDSVNRTVHEAVEGFGPVDIMVNNAQKVPPVRYPVEEMDEAEWDIAFQTGTKGTLYFCKAVFPHMKDRGGKIINIGSRIGIEGRPLYAHYAAAKEAIRGFSRTLAREWGKYRINVNVICPSALTGARLAANMGVDDEKILASRPVPRWGDPEADVGRTAVFLASSDSDFITGQTLMVDGGDHMF